MSNDGVATWAREHSTTHRNLSDHAALIAHFAEQVEPMLRAQNKTPVWWNDRYEHSCNRALAVGSPGLGSGSSRN